MWLVSAAIIAAHYLLAMLAKLAGWQICLGFLAGGLYVYCYFRWHYGWWPDFGLDGEDDRNANLPRINRRR